MILSPTGTPSSNSSKSHLPKRLLIPKYASNVSFARNSCTKTIPRLFQSHEILSEECDLFRVRSNKKYYSRRNSMILSASGIAMLIIYFMCRDSTSAWFWVAIAFLLCVMYVYIKLQIIEESILLINGLGVQVTVTDGFGHEESTFMATESIESAYIFESFDGWTTRNFFSIKDKNGENFIIFQNLKPSIDFMRRLYRHFQHHINKINTTYVKQCS